MAGEKTEKATPKRRRDERKKGNVFQSKEVESVFTLIVSFFAFRTLAPLFVSTVQDGIVYFMEVASHPDVMTIQT